MLGHFGFGFPSLYLVILATHTCQEWSDSLTVPFKLNRVIPVTSFLTMKELLVVI